MANSPLQQSPRGLLALFRLQTLGRAPQAFGDTVVPVSQVNELYGADSLRCPTDATTSTNPFEIITLTVPDREIWRIRALQVAAVSDAAANMSCGLSFAPPGAAVSIILAAREPVSLQANETLYAVWTAPQPFIAPAGSSINASRTASAHSVGIHARIVALVERLPE